MSGPPTIIDVSASELANGTYLCTQTDATYRLAEDVSFEPNSEHDWMPTEAQFESGEYDRDAFQAGFHSAIAVGADNVTIDLNGRTLEQSPVHALQQRFCALIGLLSPFIEGAGPLPFSTSEFTGVKTFTLKNGTLGRSSHHGIFGNECDTMILENMTIRDFEVGAVHMNHIKKLVLRNCNFPRNRTDIPVNGIYSAGRFIRLYMDMILPQLADGSAEKTEGQLIRSNLQTRMDAVLEQVRETGRTTDPLFVNPTGLIDGSAYAVVVNGRGPAVNDFAAAPTAESKMSEDVTIENVHVGSLLVHPVQVVGLSTPAEEDDPIESLQYGGGVQKDVAGALFQIERVLGADGTYQGNEVSEAQLFVARHKNLLPQPLASRVTISQGIIDWASPSSTKTLAEVMAEEKIVFRYNGDSMFHVMKGMIAFRFDLVRNLSLSNVIVDRAWNTAEKGIVMAGDDPNYEYGHPAQTQLGYQGCTSRALSFSGCENVSLKDVTVHALGSTNGFVCAVDAMNGTTFSRFENVNVNTLVTLDSEMLEKHAPMAFRGTPSSSSSSSSSSAQSSETTTLSSLADDVHNNSVMLIVIIVIVAILLLVFILGAVLGW